MNVRDWVSAVVTTGKVSVVHCRSGEVREVTISHYAGMDKSVWMPKANAHEAAKTSARIESKKRTHN